MWQRLLGEVARDGLPQAVLEKLAAQTGLPASNLQAGLRVSLMGLARSVEVDVARFSQNAGLRKIVILAAGNVPAIALAPAILLTSIGWPVVVKQSKHEQLVLPYLCELFLEKYPDLPDLIQPLYFDQNSSDFHALLEQADHILAFGSDQTIADLRQQHPAKVTGFGHKISFSYVDELNAEPAIFTGLARDVVLYNQQGCLSAQAIFVRGQIDEVAGWAETFAQNVKDMAAELGASCLTTAARMRRNAQIEALILRDVRHFIGPRGTCVAVVPQFSLSEVSGDCFVQVIAVADAQQALQQLQCAQKYWQAIAISAQSGVRAGLQRLFEQAGFSYVCAPGELQAPPLDWPNGGVRLPDDVLKQKAPA